MMVIFTANYIELRMIGPRRLLRKERSPLWMKETANTGRTTERERRTRQEWGGMMQRGRRTEAWHRVCFSCYAPRVLEGAGREIVRLRNLRQNGRGAREEMERRRDEKGKRDEKRPV